MENLLRRLTHALLIAVGIGASILVGIWYAPAGFALGGACLFFFIRAIRRGSFDLPAASKASDEGVTEQEAKMLVTQVLRNLTRVQVAYLSQEFQSREESRAWLKNALPRSFHQNLDEVHSNLENARLGNTPPGLRLTMQILDQRERLQKLEEALTRERDARPGYAVAHPTIFVVTEKLGAESTSQPEVQIVAGWDPSRATLLPRVDALTFYSEVDGKKHIRGHASFDAALRALGDRLRPLADSLVFVTEPLEGDPVREGLGMAKMPLGFVVGTAEFL